MTMLEENWKLLCPIGNCIDTKPKIEREVNSTDVTAFINSKTELQANITNQDSPTREDLIDSSNNCCECHHEMTLMRKDIEFLREKILILESTNKRDITRAAQLAGKKKHKKRPSVKEGGRGVNSPLSVRSLII